MSMLDGFFSKGFKGSRCKTLLKLTIPRIKLLRNRKEIQLKQMRKDIARLLETGQEATARIRVEHIIREEKMMAAHEIIELFCELINARLPIIETQKEVPLDLKEAISTICFAAPRCGDLPELLEVQMLFGAKYGKEFVQAATELMPDCGVNRQIITLLSVRAPPVEDKMKLLKEIAEEYKVEWDPADTEAELLKPHEDLLSGPSQFISGSKLPLPKEKHDESIYSSSKKSETSQHDHESDLEMLDFPEVPRTSLRPGSGTGGGATNPILPPPPPPPPFDMGFKPVTHESGLDTIKSNQASNLRDEIKTSFTDTKSFLNTQEDKGGYSDAAENIHASSRNTQDRTSSEMREEKPVFLSGISPSTTTSSAVVDTVFESREETTLSSDKASSAPLCRPTLDSSVYKNESQELPIPFPSAPSLIETPRSRTMSSSQRTKSSMDVDFQDVLLAAQNAADSAERAAAAARAAATLAQTKISELSMFKKEENDEIFDSSSNINVFAPDFTDERASHDHESERAKPLSSSEMPQFDWKFSDSTEDDVKDYLHSHQPQRSSSLEDDPYDSYPNLFSSQTSKDKRIDP